MDMEAWLSPIVRELLYTQPYVSFLLGRNGEFDECAASLIKRLRRSVGTENSDMTLVLPYTVAAIPYYEAYYDAVMIPESACRVHHKAAIFARNRWMVEQSSLVLAYIEHPTGGAYAAMRYALKINRRVIATPGAL